MTEDTCQKLMELCERCGEVRVRFEPPTDETPWRWMKLAAGDIRSAVNVDMVNGGRRDDGRIIAHLVEVAYSTWIGATTANSNDIDAAWHRVPWALDGSVYLGLDLGYVPTREFIAAVSKARPVPPDATIAAARVHVVDAYERVFQQLAAAPSDW